LTTLKQKQDKETDSWLAVNPVQRATVTRGVRPWAQRKQFHDLNALHDAHVPAVTTAQVPVDQADAIARCRRLGLPTDQAGLDHAALYQEGSIRTAALEAGGSVNRYNARNQLHTALRNLPEATMRRHTRQGLIAYRAMHASLTRYARQLIDLGGETVAIPAMLASDAETVGI